MALLSNSSVTSTVFTRIFSFLKIIIEQPHGAAQLGQPKNSTIYFKLKRQDESSMSCSL